MRDGVYIEHFGAGVPCPCFLADEAIGEVGHVYHGGEEETVLERVGADLKGFKERVHTLCFLFAF